MEDLQQSWNFFISNTDLDISEFDMIKEFAYIKRVGSEYCVFSEKGKRMGCYKTRKEAEKRLKQIEYWKNQKGAVDEEASQYCYCSACGAEFTVRSMCHLERCPVCGDDDLVELTGVV